MAIQVTCSKCLKRFSVGDQHAGKQGPCPNCKATITIPKKEEEVVIHAPEPTGPVDSKGRSVLKTTKRTDSKFNVLIAVAAGGVALLFLLAAILLRGKEIVTADTTQALLVLGGLAAVLGPLVSWAGYQFLRDDELEPYRGTQLWLRSVAAGVIYAGLWFLYGYILGQFFSAEDIAKGVDWYYPAICLAIAIAAGALTAHVSFDLDPTMGALHYAFFVVICVILRVVMHLPLLPGLGGVEA